MRINQMLTVKIIEKLGIFTIHAMTNQLFGLIEIGRASCRERV